MRTKLFSDIKFDTTSYARPQSTHGDLIPTTPESSSRMEGNEKRRQKTYYENVKNNLENQNLYNHQMTDRDSEKSNFSWSSANNNLCYCHATKILSMLIILNLLFF